MKREYTEYCKGNEVEMPDALTTTDKGTCKDASDWPVLLISRGLVITIEIVSSILGCCWVQTMILSLFQLEF